MINRENWLDTKKYYEYLRNVLQLDEQTIHRRREQLRPLLEWAGSKPFGSSARMIDPTFPVYLATARFDGKKKSLAPATLKDTCNVVRGFFEWARREMPRKYPNIKPSWIDTLRPAKSRGMQTVIKKHEFYSLDEIIRIVRLPVTTLFEERSQAAIAFMYLSAARASAFASLPISCVNLQTSPATIYQYPGEGVRTKNHKAQETYLLPIPAVMAVVQAWDDKVRSLLPENSMWFASIDTAGENLVPCYDPPASRRGLLEKACRCICDMAGIEYKSPHKIRHGHGVYVRKHAKTLAEFKAGSQNMMHASSQITDETYGGLGGDDIKNAIANMRELPPGIEIEGLSELAKVLKEHPGLMDALGGEKH